MPATAAPAHAPAVEAPRHPLPALATFELAGYRRMLGVHGVDQGGQAGAAQHAGPGARTTDRSG